jgi:hypothetical protein
MKILKGSSQDKDPQKAVSTATQDWGSPNDLQLLIVFYSSSYDPKGLHQALTAKFPEVPLIGCSTSGECYEGERFVNSIAVFGLSSDKLKCSVLPLTNVSNINQDDVIGLADRLTSNLGCKRDDLDANRFFCLAVMDGLSMKEENTYPLVADALEGVTLFGGSAGDDTKFEKTTVLCNDGVFSDAGVFALTYTKEDFEIFKHQHFMSTGQDMVITEVDEATRRVLEIDGYPAAERYAELVGKSPKDLNAEVFSLHPVAFCYNDELYIRSVQKLNDDMSLSFYCAIEEGMVVEMVKHSDMAKALEDHIDDINTKFSEVDGLIAFNCILRSLEASANSEHSLLGEKFRNLTSNVVGFDTYGECLNGFHINQTLVSLVIGKKRETEQTQNAA